MSSGASLRYTSRPLHSGQTRISSSFGSTPVIELLGEPRAERGIRLGAHRQHPPVGPRSAAQFYRVLLREQHRRIVAEVEVRGRETVMIGERVRHDLKTGFAEVAEKTLRIADSGSRMHTFEARKRRALACIRHAMRSTPFQPELRDDGVHAAQPPLRLAQRPRRKEKTRAEPPRHDHSDYGEAAFAV